MALTIRLIPGRVLAAGDLITEDVLNDLGNPTVELDGSVSTSTIGDNSVTLPKLVVGILTADASGRSRMADGFVTATKLDATQDLTGKTISGNPSVTLTGAVTLSGAVNLSGATVTGVPAGWPVQFVSVNNNATTTISASIPTDSTTPLYNEGTKLAALDCTITPKSVTNKLVVRVSVAYIPNSARAIVALFRDATTNQAAIFADGTTATTDYQQRVTFEWVVTAGSLSATTFQINIGKYASDGGDVRLNQITGGNTLGGIIYSTVSVTEITA